MKSLFELLTEDQTNPYDIIMEKSVISPQTDTPIMGGTVEFASSYFPPKDYNHKELKDGCDKFGNIIYSHENGEAYSTDEIEELEQYHKRMSEYIDALKGTAQSITKPHEELDIEGAIDGHGKPS